MRQRCGFLLALVLATLLATAHADGAFVRPPPSRQDILDVASREYAHGHLAAAIAELEEGTRRYPDSALVWQVLAQARLLDKDQEGARSAYQHYLALRPPAVPDPARAAGADAGRDPAAARDGVAQAPGDGGAGAPGFQPAAPDRNRFIVDAFRDCEACPLMRPILGGVFDRGTPASEAGRYPNEGPDHDVAVSGFSIGLHHVTRAQFAAFVADSGYAGGNSCWISHDGHAEPQDGRDWRAPGHPQSEDFPVVCVSWDDAQAYLRWLSRKAGRTYRLPTSAEWEFAARAGAMSARPWGESTDEACLWANVGDRRLRAAAPFLPGALHNCDDGYVFTSPVASYRANALGLFDMLGNAWQWVDDCQAPAGTPATQDTPVGATPTCSARGLRGGSWANKPRDVRSGRLEATSPETRSDTVGFRVATQLP